MSYYTPLRYPGGKRRLADFVMRLLDESRLKDVHYFEPFAGGAAIGLALLLEERAASIHINDLSRPIYAFWYSVLNHNEDLCKRIKHTKVTMRDWRRNRSVYEQQEEADLVDLGFATLFLNRTNRSGIVGGGPIGGKNQSGFWKLDVRFNKQELVQRIRRIGRYRNRIMLYQRDALEFTDQVVSRTDSNTFTFYDPPYIESGKGLYLNNYGLEDHRKLASRIARVDKPWVVVYDYAAIKHEFYEGCRRIVYGLKYTAQSRHEGREVMFLSGRVAVPCTQGQSGRIRIRPDGSRFQVYGTVRTAKRERGSGTAKACKGGWGQGER